MNELTKLRIRVEAESAGLASRQAQALEMIVQEEAPAAQIDRVRETGDTLDGGATLAVALASPVLIELARALRMFLQRYHSSAITISDASGSIIAKNVSSATIDSIAAEWAKHRDVER
jgi:hypothetical protein